MTLFILIILICAGILVFWYIRNKSENNEQSQQEPVESKAENDSVDDLLETIENERRRIEAFIQAGIVGDQLTASAINSGTYNGPLPERRSDGGWLSIYDNLRILKIAGINHRSGISRYVGRVECALVPEPDNEYDPDAIKIVAEDRHHLGYIPGGQTELVCSLSANEFPYHCTAFIEDHDDEDDGHHFFTGFVYIKRLD